MVEFKRPDEPTYNSTLYGDAFGAAVLGHTQVVFKQWELTPANQGAVADAFKDAADRGLAPTQAPSIIVSEEATSTPEIRQPFYKDPALWLAAVLVTATVVGGAVDVYKNTAGRPDSPPAKHEQQAPANDSQVWERLSHNDF